MTAIWLPTVPASTEWDHAAEQSPFRTAGLKPLPNVKDRKAGALEGISPFPPTRPRFLQQSAVGHEDAGCFCNFLGVHEKTSWRDESSEVYLLGRVFLSCQTEGRSQAEISDQHELHEDREVGGKKNRCLETMILRPNYVPSFVSIPAGFKRCVQTAHQNCRGGKAAASLIKEHHITKVQHIVPCWETAQR